MMLDALVPALQVEACEARRRLLSALVKLMKRKPWQDTRESDRSLIVDEVESIVYDALAKAYDAGRRNRDMPDSSLGTTDWDSPPMPPLCSRCLVVIGAEATTLPRWHDGKYDRCHRAEVCTERWEFMLRDRE